MLKLLRRIIDELNAAEGLQTVLQTLVSRVRQSIDAPACAIFLLNPETQQFQLMAAEGYGDNVIGYRFPLEQGLVGLVAKRNEPVNIADVDQHDVYVPLPDTKQTHYHALLGVPISHQRKLLGVLVVRREEKACFDEAEEAFLVTVSSQLASVIAQAEVTEKIAQADITRKTLGSAVFDGIASVPGVAIGQAAVVFPLADLDAVPEKTTENPQAEIVNFHEALANTRDEIRVLGKRLSSHLPKEEQALFDAYLKLLESTRLISEVEKEIQSGMWAQTALQRVIKKHVKQFRSMDNEYLSERASDVEDLGRRILNHLQTEQEIETQYPEKTILVGEELTASHLASVPEGQLAGVVSVKGSSSSHVAILARALGIPTIMGVSALSLKQLQNKTIIVDGYIGRVHVAPSLTILKEYRRLQREEHYLDEDLQKLRKLPAETLDGHRVKLYVNTGLMADVSRSLTAGAEGVGLYRTEVPFMVRDHFPTSQEQYVIYKQLLSAFSPLPVTMRTLDIGGDKQLSYFPIQDDNPFLGWRGVRVSLDHPDIFQGQVRAMMRANEGNNNLRIMLPMISDVSELDEALAIIRKVHGELGEDGANIVMPQVGVMIEVPSAVYQAKLLAERADFLSVGSNDLTQYILAVDRNNARVASLYDSLHPAVLEALQRVVKGAHAVGKPASVCGEMAGDPLTALLLVAMGYDALSMSATMLPRIKWVIRQFKLRQAKKLLAKAMACETAPPIRELLQQALENAGCGGLIRAGR